jgi:phosphoribosylcarboxyaminoimidazole (NCAIR) mutase
MSTRSISIFKDPHVAKHLSLLHDKRVISAHKAPNNIVFVCK